MYILRQINFADILKQPVMNFVMNLNGTDDDRKAFKLKLSKEGGAHGIDSDQMNSGHNSNFQNKSNNKA
jgi:hypothetical protein